jgi:hypothetical protein
VLNVKRKHLLFDACSAPKKSCIGAYAVLLLFLMMPTGPGGDFSRSQHIKRSSNSSGSSSRLAQLDNFLQQQ